MPPLPHAAPPSPPAAATPMAFVRTIALGFRRHGMDPAETFRQAQITPAQLQDPDGRITAAQLELVSGLAMQRLDDEALGWFSRRLPWGTHGLLCRASITAPTLGVALKRWCRHHRLLTDDVRLQLELTGDEAELSVRERHVPAAMREFCLLSCLRYVLGFACWAIDSRITMRAASWPFEAPPHRDVYALLFDCPLQFDAACASVRFDAHYLDLPLQRDEPALRTMLQRPLPLMVRLYRRDRLLVQQVRELLRRRGAQLARAEQVAQALHLSARTLHRQLRQEGASLQNLRDEVRCAQALDQLRRTRRSVKQIAFAVGYGDEKSFARAFKGWTGLSPSQARRSSLPSASA